MLENEFNIPVILEDESYSTLQAKKYMIDANISRAKQKKKKDMIAAQIILQQYLNKQ